MRYGMKQKRLKTKVEMESIKRWNRIHSWLMLLGLILIVFTQQLEVFILLSVLSFLTYIFSHWSFLKTFKPFAGYANWVTGFRLGLILIGAVGLDFWTPLQCFPFFLIGLCLDGLDGYLARKFNHGSDFGAYFDMETDSFYVAILASFWWLSGMVGGWILFIGFLRYIYVFFLKILNVEKKPEKSTRFAKTIAVIIMIALLIPFAFPAFLYTPILIIASALTVYSFGVSFVSKFEN